jgi:hypothetical protein
VDLNGVPGTKHGHIRAQVLLDEFAQQRVLHGR